MDSGEPKNTRERWLRRRGVVQRQRDLRQGIDDPLLARMREIATRTGREDLLRDYERRLGMERHRDYQKALAMQAGLEPACPFQLPSEADFPLLDIPERGFRLGTIGANGEGLYLDLQQLLLRGLSITGAKGTGKSTLLQNIAYSLRHADSGVVLFNTRGEHSDHLPDFAHLQASELPINIFSRQPELEPKAQAEATARIIGSQFHLLRSRTMLTPVLLSFYERDVSPTAVEVLQAVRKIRAGKSSGFRADQVTSAVAVLELICRAMGKNASTLRGGFLPHRRAQNNMTVLLDLGDQDVHSAVICWVLWSSYEHAIAQGIINAPLRTAILVDESKYLLSPEREKRSTTFDAPFIDQLVRTQRTAGIALVAATQDLHPDYFNSNSATKVLMRVANAKFFQQTALAMGLTREEQLYAQRNLRRFEAIISVPDLFPRPLLCILEAPFTEKQTAQQREQLRDQLLGEIQQYVKYDHVPESQPAETQRSQQKPLVKGAGALLGHYAEHPLTPLTDAYNLLSLSRAGGDAARNHLTRNELATAAKVRLRKGRGGTCMLLEPTKKGIAWLRSHHPALTPKRLPGKGSLEHRVHQHLVAEHFRQQGCIVKVEHQDADLAIEEGSGWLAVEIANTNSSNLRERVQRNEQAGATRTIVVCSDAKTLRRLRGQLSGSEVEVQDISRYLLSSGQQELEL